MKPAAGTLGKDLAPPLIALAIGVVASVLGALQVQHIVAEQDRYRFEHTVRQAEDAIADRLGTYIAMLRAGAGFMASHNLQVDRTEFRRFVNQLKLPEQYPGVQGIGFSARLPDTQTGSQETLLNYGHPDLAVRPPTAEGEEVHAIVHLEPLDRRNLAALGYNMFSEPTRREAMERARDTGMPAASSRVKLVQEIEERVQAGFLIYVPVYRTGSAPVTLAERRAELQGFIYSPFRGDDLMHGIFADTDTPALDIAIYAGEPDDSTLLHRSSQRRIRNARFSDARNLKVAGRTWTVRYGSGPEFDAQSSRSLVPWFFAGGLAATLLLTAVTWSQTRAKRRANEAVVALERNARKLEVLHSTATQLSGELDPDRLVQGITDAGRELSGAEIGAFFFNALNEDGERYQLYTVSGAPRAAFAHLEMPRRTPLLDAAFSRDEVVRSPDITTDIRFGRNSPHGGFPSGHWPVRSYLAVPVTSRSGEVLGALLFGHSQVNTFDEQTERSIVALASHAAIAVDNARLFKASQEEIAARKKVEEHQKLLLDELNHRVKNTLATVQSIALQTMRSAPDAATFRQSFEARLMALSEAHNLLSRSNWRGVELRDLVRRELAPHGVDDPARVTIEGERVWLPPAFGVALGMALHELATNAARHGSLRSSKGHVAVNWTVSPLQNGRRLRLTWKETGGPPVAEPLRRGFGSRMIERGLRHDLRGEAKLYFEHDGVRCVIEAAIPSEQVAA